MGSVKRAAINCTFASQTNPKENECLQEFEKWIKQFPSTGDEYQKLVALVSRSMPQASSDYLLFASKVVFLEKRLIQVLNNKNGEKLETIERLLNMVQKMALDDFSGISELSPIEKTAADIVNSGKHFLNQDFEKRFLSKLISYLKAMSELENQRRQGYLPSLTELLTIRQCSSSAEMFIELCEMGMNISMNDENRCDSVIQRLVKTVIKMSFIGNDLASFECCEDYNTNVVNAVKRCRNYDWQKAVDEAIHLYTCELSSFTAIEKLIDTDEMSDGKTVKKYMKMLKSVAKAMHEFNELSKEKSVRIQ